MIASEHLQMRELRVSDLTVGDLIILEDEDFRTMHKRGSLRIVTDLLPGYRSSIQLHVLDVVSLDNGFYLFEGSKVMRVFG